MSVNSIAFYSPFNVCWIRDTTRLVSKKQTVRCGALFALPQKFFYMISKTVFLFLSPKNSP